MGSNKAALMIEGKTFLTSIAEKLISGSCSKVIFVTGFYQDVVVPKGVQAIVNPEPSRGMFSSLWCGLQLVPLNEPVVVQLVDLPLVRLETYQSIIASCDPVGTKAVYQGKGGHPIKLSASTVALLKEAPEDYSGGLRRWFQDKGLRLSRLAVLDAGVVTDIDEPKDYQRWVQSELNS